MKAILTAIMALSISSAAFSADLNQTALSTLLASKAGIAGDVLESETLASIYQSAVENDAKISNECSVVQKDEAKCTLWLTFSPMGETALEYTVNAAGDKLLSQIVNVSRGD